MNKWQKILDQMVSGEMLPGMMPPYVEFLSMPMVTGWQNNRVHIDWQAHDGVYQGMGKVFGGYISALADYAAGLAMLTILDEQDLFATHKLEVKYKKPMRAGAVQIVAAAERLNERHFQVMVTFTADNGEVCAESEVHQTLLAR